MNNQTSHENATSNVLTWTTHAANIETEEEDDGADADEPPPLAAPVFKRAPVRRGSEHQESLLTKALQSHSEEESNETSPVFRSRRRRSITSTVSMASTAELTCSTGITTPARTSSPSPRLPDVGFVPLVPKPQHAHPALGSPVNDWKFVPLAASAQPQPDPTIQALQRKRCISFACAAKPTKGDRSPPPPPAPNAHDEVAKAAAQETPKRSCIKFACPTRPSAKASPPQPPVLLTATPAPRKTPIAQKEDSPSSKQKHRSPSTLRSLRSLTPRRTSQSPVNVRSKKYLTAHPNDLQSEASRFHEFASDEPQEDDWIRRDNTFQGKLTIDDTLRKENAIRRLGKEAEEEAALEEEIDGENVDGESPDGDDLDNADDDEEDVDEEVDSDNYSGYSSDDDASDGYNTDNEVGFADSDDEDDDLDVWNLGRATQVSMSNGTPVQRRVSFSGHHSDSSIGSRRKISAVRARREAHHLDIRAGTPELPDSTDFVCGTLDEDRPLEDAYISCIAARKKEKHRPIPQDIDPSFPASEPEDEEDELYRQGDSDDQVWLHGEIEDIHHEQHDRTGRKKKVDNQSPRRYRSPPPKRHHSPPPKGRGRSPRRLFDRQSPRRFKSPPQQMVQSPPASPVQTGQGIAFKSLAFRPGLTQTKSLPKAPALFPHAKGRKSRAGTLTKHKHMRGAIDIVKGLEQKRQRRKEKFYQKYCQNRARKERAPERRPPPGQGAERMREIGLLMAGKIGQGNYVLSV